MSGLATVLCATTELFAASSPLDDSHPIVLPVWPGATVGDFGTIGPERVRSPEDAPTTTATWITNVTHPTISVFRAPVQTNTGAAVIVCPGGGYWNLAWDLEGEEVAEWLSQAGITAIVLKYRVPRRPGQPEPLPAPGPLLDAQRAISLVRGKSTDWEIDPNRIGIMGFSAGGHLAVATATQFEKRAYDPIDEVDVISCRPDFAVAVYPGYLVEEDGNEEALAPYIQIPAETPPIFLVHASDDQESSPLNSIVMYGALQAAGVSAEVHVYDKGGHGFGVRETGLPCSAWKDQCLGWLRGRRIVPASAIP